MQTNRLSSMSFIAWQNITNKNKKRGNSELDSSFQQIINGRYFVVLNFKALIYLFTWADCRACLGTYYFRKHDWRKNCMPFLVWLQNLLLRLCQASHCSKMKMNGKKTKPVPIPLSRISRNFPDVNTRNKFFFSIIGHRR